MSPAHSHGASSAAGAPAGSAKTEAVIGDDVLRVSAVDRVAGELRVVAEVLAARPAIGANPAGRGEPRNADTVAARERIDRGAGIDHRADDFMTGNDRRARVRELAVDDVQIGSTDAAGVDFHQQLARRRDRSADVQELERSMRGIEHHRVHRDPPPERESESIARPPKNKTPSTLTKCP